MGSSEIRAGSSRSELAWQERHIQGPARWRASSHSRSAWTPSTRRQVGALHRQNIVVPFSSPLRQARSLSHHETSTLVVDDFDADYPTLSVKLGINFPSTATGSGQAPFKIVGRVCYDPPKSNVILFLAKQMMQRGQCGLCAFRLDNAMADGGNTGTVAADCPSGSIEIQLFT